ncbi:sialate O-acetylesterase [Acinetobacter haemolyticus]|uniref:sialate O-acetylesterase n=1 Tax=Acinetobacter haemolyticus TaxID=29430 RepID=UPI0024DE1570|nr:sialate O-acetylesterase [Acinetobacter haemolyticus]
MAVPEQIPYVGYVANGDTTQFPIVFDLHDPAYLIVTVNKEIPTVGTYSVDMNSLKVVFATAPSNGDQVELYRETTLNRDTNYQKYDNSFRPEAVNYDFDKIIHILQEQHMIDAELASRLKQEIEWRRTHDANFDELSKMRDSQIFSGLKQYLDTILAGVNPNIFDGITAGIVFALDKKSVQTHLEIIYEQLNESREDVSIETERALAAEQQLQQNISNEELRAANAEASLQAQINANGVGNRAYKTFAEMDADKSNIPANSKVTVTNDANSSNNGDWQWDGTTFTKSVFGPDTNAFFKPKPITVNDLNLLVEEGFFYADAGTSANIANKPAEVTGSMYVLVRKLGPSSNIVMQEIVDNQLQSFSRRRPNATDWTDYENYPTKKAVLALIKAAQAIKTIKNGDDLNNVTEKGVYFTSSYGSILNVPPEITAAFKLDVESEIIASNLIVYQTITGHTNITLKRRYNGSSWSSSWALQTNKPRELAVATDLNSFVGDGIWFVQNVNNGLISNKPSIATHAFTISNVSYTFGANTVCLQTITNHLNRSVSRRTANSGTTWTTFDEVVTTANVADIIAPYIPEIPSDIGVFGDQTLAIGQRLSAYQLPDLADINHFLSYGQSLSIGAGGQPAISLTQYASNLTFAGGPRAASGNYLPVKPLVEDDLNALDGGTNRGETLCSGAANYASQQMLKQNGIKPQDHVILATAGGRGGYRISQLNKGTTWYENNMLAHITNAVNHCATNSLTYSMPLVSWAQGEFDQNKTDITREQYAAMLEQLQVDMQTDIKTRSGMKTRIPFVTYQTSWYSRLRNHVALAQLDVVKRNEDFYFSTPMYHLPHADDNLHLNNVGNKLFGCYVGRVYKQLVIDQIHPEFLCPISAEMQGTKIIVRFHVPKAPMVLDAVNLAATTDHGFKVVDNVGATVAHSSIAVASDGTKIEIELGSVPVNPIKVRYALDYLGAGLTIGDGASGNLRDSTDDQVSFGGNTYNLWHVCPHFELDVLNLQV